MIPAQNIVAWGNVVPWADQRQVEQDLIISRALVEIFSDQTLRGALHNLAHALEVFEGLDADRIVEMFGRYLDLSGKATSRAQAQERMFAKLAQPRFLLDMRPLLPAVASGSSDGRVDSRVVSPRVHDACRSAARRALRKNAGYEGTARPFLVREPTVMLAAAGVATRMRGRSACTAATLGLL